VVGLPSPKPEVVEGLNCSVPRADHVCNPVAEVSSKLFIKNFFSWEKKTTIVNTIKAVDENTKHQCTIEKTRFPLESLSISLGRRDHVWTPAEAYAALSELVRLRPPRPEDLTAHRPGDPGTSKGGSMRPGKR